MRDIVGGEKMARAFKTRFDSISDFNGFYITPPKTLGCDHGLATALPFPGLIAHKSEVFGIIPPKANGKWEELVRRGYPTIQFHKSGEIYKTPIAITLKLWLDIDLVNPGNGEATWFSPITFTSDTSDLWSPVYTLVIGESGYLSWEHVPTFSQSNKIYQASAANGGPKFPMKKLVKLDIFIDSNPITGYVKVWQDGILASHADLRSQNGFIDQIHAGFYSHASVSRGVCYNTLLEGKEVSSEAEAVSYFNRSTLTPFDVGIYSGKGNSLVYPIKPMESYSRVSMIRNAWAANGGDVAKVKQSISVDNGVTWIDWGGFTTPGGNIINKDGNTISGCSFVTMFPFPQQESENRLIKMEIDAILPISTLIEIELSENRFEVQEILK
jgi:hypothetical protein